MGRKRKDHRESIQNPELLLEEKPRFCPDCNAPLKDNQCFNPDCRVISIEISWDENYRRWAITIHRSATP